MASTFRRRSSHRRHRPRRPPDERTARRGPQSRRGAEPEVGAEAGSGSREADDWLGEPVAWTRTTSEWLAEPAGELAGGDPRARATSRRLRPASHDAVDRDSAALAGDGPAGARRPGPATAPPLVGAGPPRDPRTMWTRRLIAVGVVLVALGAIVLLAKAALGGGERAGAGGEGAEDG